jgi:hypothetical protein
MGLKSSFAVEVQDLSRLALGDFWIVFDLHSSMCSLFVFGVMIPRLALVSKMHRLRTWMSFYALRNMQSNHIKPLSVEAECSSVLNDKFESGVIFIHQPSIVSSNPLLLILRST